MVAPSGMHFDPTSAQGGGVTQRLLLDTEETPAVQTMVCVPVCGAGQAVVHVLPSACVPQPPFETAVGARQIGAPLVCIPVINSPAGHETAAPPVLEPLISGAHPVGEQSSITPPL